MLTHNYFPTLSPLHNELGVTVHLMFIKLDAHELSLFYLNRTISLVISITVDWQRYHFTLFHECVSLFHNHYRRFVIASHSIQTIYFYSHPFNTRREWCSNISLCVRGSGRWCYFIELLFDDSRYRGGNLSIWV